MRCQGSKRKSLSRTTTVFQVTWSIGQCFFFQEDEAALKTLLHYEHVCPQILKFSSTLLVEYLKIGFEKQLNQNLSFEDTCCIASILDIILYFKYPSKHINWI